ncbi:MAG: peptide chain release factor N(5)-glutamine methyltransferase [Elusimicrobiaceae bacterium]|nr:peptide chain release factor N(5)-glutamine methyltransferase [Elusimicrobiaceae bacterium]
MKTVKQVVFEVTNILNSANVAEAAANAEFIVCNLLGKSRTEILAFGSSVFPKEKEKILNSVIKQKIEGKPLEYIFNSASFLGRKFYVDERVLIPRSETEELVLKTQKKLKTTPKNILDLCTGSGCIGISLALNFPVAQVTCSDISAPALEVAKQNAATHKAKINFIESDLFNNLQGKFDLIISNPPYIKEDDIKTLSPEVKKEPRLAQIGGKEGTEIIEKIIQAAPKFLAPGGLLALEIGDKEGQKVLQFFSRDIWSNYILAHDFAGLERYIFAIKR